MSRKLVAVFLIAVLPGCSWRKESLASNQESEWELITDHPFGDKPLNPWEGTFQWTLRRRKPCHNPINQTTIERIEKGMSERDVDNLFGCYPNVCTCSISNGRLLVTSIWQDSDLLIEVHFDENGLVAEKALIIPVARNRRVGRKLSY